MNMIHQHSDECCRWSHNQMDAAKSLWTTDPTETYLRTMAALHPDWRPIQVLQAVLDQLAQEPT